MPWQRIRANRNIALQSPHYPLQGNPRLRVKRHQARQRTPIHSSFLLPFLYRPRECQLQFPLGDHVEHAGSQGLVG